MKSALINDMSDSLPRRIIFFAERHEPASAHDELQLSRLQELIAQHEHNADDLAVCHFFVEVPCGPKWGQFHKKVTHDLIDTECRKTNIENIEIRERALAAQWILGLDLSSLCGVGVDFFSKTEFSSAHRTCMAGEVTFQNLLDDYEFYQKDIDKWISQLPKQVQTELLLLHVRQREQAYQDLLKLFPQEHVFLCRPLKDIFSCVATQEKTEVVDKVKNQLSALYSTLFEEYMFKTVCSASQDDIAVVVAGGLHTEIVCSLLHAAGGERAAFVGDAFGQVPLKSEQISLE